MRKISRRFCWVSAGSLFLGLAFFGSGAAHGADDAVDDLRRRVEELERLVQELREEIRNQEARGTTKPSDSPFLAQPPADGANSSGARPGASTGSDQDVIITVTKVLPAATDQAALDEAGTLDRSVSKAQAEIAALEVQKTKLYDLFKELEKRWNANRSMSDVEYKRLCQENKNQRDDLTKQIAQKQNQSNIWQRKAKSLRKGAVPVGQLIEGVDGSGQTYSITTKVNCSKVVRVGARVTSVNLKVTSSQGTTTIGTADKVVAAP